MYLRQHRRAGVLGLVGYLVFAVGYLAMFGVELMGATVLPELVDTEPGFVNDVVVAATGGTPTGDIGGVQILFDVMAPATSSAACSSASPSSAPASWPAGPRPCSP